MAKTVLYKATFAEDEQIVAVMQRGDLEINEVKLVNALDALNAKWEDSGLKAAVSRYLEPLGRQLGEYEMEIQTLEENMNAEKEALATLKTALAQKGAKATAEPK